MKPSVPLLAPLLRSDAQGDILALLFLNPGDEFTIAQVAKRTHALLATVHREITRFIDTGIAADRYLGRAHLVRANTTHPLAGPLTELLLLSYGPRTVLEPLVADLPGVKEAYIYGSWAARYVGEPGPAPRDIDVLVVGSTPQSELFRVGEEARQRLGREVNLTRVSPQEWAAPTGPFAATLRTRPLVALDLAKKED